MSPVVQSSQGFPRGLKKKKKKSQMTNVVFPSKKKKALLLMAITIKTCPRAQFCDVCCIFLESIYNIRIHLFSACGVLRYHLLNVSFINMELANLGGNQETPHNRLCYVKAWVTGIAQDD